MPPFKIIVVVVIFFTDYLVTNAPRHSDISTKSQKSRIRESMICHIPNHLES